MSVQGRLIPVPNLDDRDFRAIRDAMVKAIPEKTPEWTDWNLSDPGITLIELFASQVEELTYRLNQVLPKHMKEYLNLIGVTLTPPSTAAVFCFFKTAVKPTFTITVPKGFQVATAAAGGEEEQVFSTDTDLVIAPARVHACLVERMDVLADLTAEARGTTGPFNPLPDVAPGDVLYLAYNENNYFQKIAFAVDQPASGVAGAWEYLRAHPDGSTSWDGVTVKDGTEGFTASGAVEFEIPADWEAGAVGEVRGTWLRFRVTAVEAGGTFATLTRIDLDDVFGRVACSNASEVAEEILGSSDGTIDQRFYLSNVPVLDLTLLVDEGGGFQVWREVDDLASSQPNDKCFAMNKGTGTIIFGDGHHGRVPAAGSNNVKAAPYRFGGGTKGNVGAGTITRLRDSHPFVTSVTNKEPAAGGGDEETVEDAVERGPTEQIKARHRAVTAEDFETLTLESSSAIARARTLPHYDPAEPAVPKPGLVSVIVLPKGGAPLSLALRAQIIAFLDERRLVTTRVFVVEPDFISFDVAVRVAKKPEANPVTLEAELTDAIRRFYDPETGGDTALAVDAARGVDAEPGEGWPFGRPIYLSELYELLERMPGVDHVEEVVAPSANIAVAGQQLPRLGAVTVVVV